MKTYIQTLICGVFSLALIGNACGQTKTAGPVPAAPPSAQLPSEAIASNATMSAAAPAAAPMAATVLESASRIRYLSKFAEAVNACGLGGRLSTEDQEVTVFAPANAAFKKLPEDALAGLLDPKNKRSLKLMLTYHVVPGRIPSADLVDGAVFTTVNGEKLEVKVIGDKIYIGGAQLMLANVESGNGVTHVIDSVLLPSSF